MKKTQSTALVVGGHSHDPLGLRLSCKAANSTAVVESTYTAMVESTYKYMVKSIIEWQVSIPDSCLSNASGCDILPDRSFHQGSSVVEWHTIRNVQFWGRPLLTVDYMKICLQSANELTATRTQEVSLNRGCELYLDNCSLPIAQSTCLDIQRWSDRVQQYLSPEKKSRKSKSGKLQKKPKRDIEDAIADLELHIQKNHDLFESWFSLARQVVIDDGGALAGNKRKRHIS